MKTGRDKPEGVENIDEIKFDEKGLIVILSYNNEKIGELEVEKEGRNGYRMTFDQAEITANSPLGLTGSENTEKREDG